ncbi:head-tail connector protein [Azorhizobium sp. AG788]|uniref:head-tail connector protein n=1 Tax=Azorhizobium sp. AG788 TaxID=2183897 RepID=UPI003139DD19
MYVTVIERPEPVIGLDEAKAHLRVDFADDDDVIDGLIRAAQTHIDGPSGWLRRAVGPQVLQLTMDGGDLVQGCPVVLPFPPFISLVSFVYDDAAGQEQTFADGSVMVTRKGHFAHLLPAYGEQWPVPRSSRDAVRITWRAGYEDYAADAAPVRQAMLLLIGHWYNNREAVNVGNIVTTFPMAVEALLSPFRVWDL